MRKVQSLKRSGKRNWKLMNPEDKSSFAFGAQDFRIVVT